MTEPKWSFIYAELKKLTVNDVMTNEQIESLTGLSIDAARGYFYRAVREFEVQQQRTVESIRGVGYRVVAANEHERLVRKDILTMRRKGRRAYSKTINVRRADLTQDERQRLEGQSLKLKQLEEMHQRLATRQARFEQVQKDNHREMKETSAAIAERVEKLERMLAERHTPVVTFQEPE